METRIAALKNQLEGIRRRTARIDVIGKVEGRSSGLRGQTIQTRSGTTYQLNSKPVKGLVNTRESRMEYAQHYFPVGYQRDRRHYLNLSVTELRKQVRDAIRHDKFIIRESRGVAAKTPLTAAQKKDIETRALQIGVPRTVDRNLHHLQNAAIISATSVSSQLAIMALKSRQGKRKHDAAGKRIETP